jgi:dihydroorotase-like cyclic amidohydrolase
MNQPYKIQSRLLKTKCGWSPYETMVFPGHVDLTIVKGKVYKNDI